MTAPDIRGVIRGALLVPPAPTATWEEIPVGAIPALARRMAPLWSAPWRSVQPASADTALRRYLRDGRTMRADDLETLLGELRLRVVAGPAEEIVAPLTD